MRVSRRSGLGVLVGLMLAVTVLAQPALAEDPLYVDWSTVLPGLTASFDPNSSNVCTAGKIQCVDATVREMTKRYEDLAATCSHDTIFAMVYLRTTEMYRWSALQDGFYSDTPFINHEDAVFASYYFNAFDAYRKGDLASVPAAWKLAFDTAAARQVNANTNALLGMSAHINRDLPYVLWQIGLVKPDGTSRKPDHDKVNDFLNRVDFGTEAQTRFDPSFNLSTSTPATMNLIVAWREQAWRNAELLRSTENDPVAFAAAKAQIENFAVSESQTLKASGLYAPLSSSASRDSYCALHHNDAWT
jgi:hypothetical protein